MEQNLNKKGSLDNLHDVAINVTGPFISEIKPWNGSIDEAIATYFSLKESQLMGDSVFIVDTGTLASAAKFLEKHYSHEEMLSLEKDWSDRLSHPKQLNSSHT